MPRTPFYPGHTIDNDLAIVNQQRLYEEGWRKVKHSYYIGPLIGWPGLKKHGFCPPHNDHPVLVKHSVTGQLAYISEPYSAHDRFRSEAVREFCELFNLNAELRPDWSIWNPQPDQFGTTAIVYTCINPEIAPVEIMFQKFRALYLPDFDGNVLDRFVFLEAVRKFESLVGVEYGSTSRHLAREFKSRGVRVLPWSKSNGQSWANSHLSPAK